MSELNISSEPVVEADLGSVQSRLAQRRASLQELHSVYVDIPGYDGELVASYVPLAYKAMKAFATAAEASMKQGPEAEVNANADFILRTCTGVFVRDEVGKLHKLETRMGKGLAAYLGADVTDLTERQALHTIFPAPSDTQIVFHAGTIQTEFEKSGSSKVDEQLVGEPQAG